MARATPIVDADGLIEPGLPGAIPIGSPAWRAWLADECHHSFHFVDPTGGFTARKEAPTLPREATPMTPETPKRKGPDHGVPPLA